ncbi:lamin tail domain-containing protein [Microlunatus soli]|uniref:Lamin Tail Domain n=1 Tax=Microlunatus soli TaxID=630515 RepID=A0A1H1ZC51_9ACTN|nr:lamin tail domain-containing protein [Microlunatus soli]SDT31304.1 Lamin Tail Domain [Microlunatus soli]
MKFLRALASLLVVAGLVSGSLIATTSNADAASKLRFTKLYADSPGTDRGSNKSLNAEYVVVKNTGSSKIKIAGYKIKDKAGHTFVFPKGFVLKARRSVTVHTGRGTNTGSHLYWKQRWYVWNNTTDTAYLLNTRGSRLDTCTFPRKHSKAYVTC